MTKPYRVALIGTGNFAETHVKAMRAMGERIELVAAVNPDETRLSRFCAENNVPQAFTNTSAMLAAIQPDLVHIVTPPAAHEALALESLEAGAWVYCEKPLCGSLAAFDRIAAAEKRTGRYVSTVSQWRFGSAATHLRSLMQRGALGKPFLGICNTLWYRDQAYYQAVWRGRWASEFGGPTATLGIHLTDLFLWLMGEWREVQATVATLDRAIEMEDVAMAMVHFENGAMGNITNSVLSPRQETYLRLDFEKATVEVNALYYYTNAHWRYSALDPNDPDLSAWSNPGADLSSSLAVQLSGILDSMDRGERPLVSGSEARQILEFITSLYKAAFTRQPVQRGSILPGDPFYEALSGNL